MSWRNLPILCFGKFVLIKTFYLFIYFSPYIIYDMRWESSFFFLSGHKTDSVWLMEKSMLSPRLCIVSIVVYQVHINAKIHFLILYFIGICVYLHVNITLLQLLQLYSNCWYQVSHSPAMSFFNVILANLGNLHFHKNFRS